MNFSDEEKNSALQVRFDVAPWLTFTQECVLRGHQAPSSPPACRRADEAQPFLGPPFSQRDNHNPKKSIRRRGPQRADDNSSLDADDSAPKSRRFCHRRRHHNCTSSRWTTADAVAVLVQVDFVAEGDEACVVTILYSLRDSAVNVADARSRTCRRLRVGSRRLQCRLEADVEQTAARPCRRLQPMSPPSPQW
ncbi:hypothetical protein MTO96_043125 [Rhipicephalus appendiculatus]